MVLAEAFGGEIISCDSIQVYRGLDVGSAKLSTSQRRGIPHHLIDAIEVNEELTAGRYAQMARQALASIETRGVLPVIAGGTGFYLRALLDGLSPAPARDLVLRERLTRVAARRPGVLHRILRRYDPKAAHRIHPNDQQKLIRAIELTLLAEQPATTTQSQPRHALAGYRFLKLGLTPPRPALYQKLNERCQHMFAQGLLSEIGMLLDAGYPPTVKPLQSLGYKQGLQYLTHELPYSEAVSACQTKTRQYAKRQLTWFRNEASVHWLAGFGADFAIQQQAIELCRSFLSGKQPATSP